MASSDLTLYPQHMAPVHGHVYSDSVSPSDRHYEVICMNEELAALEGIPVDRFNSVGPAFICHRHSANKTYQEWLDSSKKLIDGLKQKPRLSKQEQAELDLLEKQRMALQYRLHHAPKPNQPSENLTIFTGEETPKHVPKEQGVSQIEAHMHRLQEIIEVYKKNDKLYPGLAQDYAEAHANDPGYVQGIVRCTKNDIAQLRIACDRYPLFVERLIENNTAHDGKNLGKDPLTIDFIKWALRSNCSVDVFVETPNERVELSAAHLDKRSGMVHGPEGIKFTLFEGMRRTLTMKIDGEDRPIQGILKDKPIPLRNRVSRDAPPYRLTIRDMIAEFRRKTTQYGNVEYMEDGVINWDAIDFSSCSNFDPTTQKVTAVSKTRIDLVSNAFKALPLDAQVRSFREALPVLKNMTKKELEERYPGQRLPEHHDDPNQIIYGLVVEATRTTPDLNVADNHGLIIVIVPVRKDVFRIFPIGLQPKEMPKNVLHKFTQLGATLEANLHYPDESFYLDNRQRTGIVHLISSKEFTGEQAKDVSTPGVMKTFIEEIPKGWAGNLIFQPLGHNCADFGQGLQRDVVGTAVIQKLKDFAREYMKPAYDPNEIDALLNNGIKYFDDTALNTVVSTVIGALMDKNTDGLIELAHSALETLSRTLMKDETNWNKKHWQEQCTHAIRHVLVKDVGSPSTHSPEAEAQVKQRQEDIRALRNGLKELLKLSIQGQQYFRIDLLRANFSNCLFYIATPLAWMHEMGQEYWILTPLYWISQLFYNLISFILLASWRSYTVTEKAHKVDDTIEVSHKKSLWTSEFSRANIITLPASIWLWKDKKPERVAQVEACVQRVLELMPASPQPIPKATPTV